MAICAVTPLLPATAQARDGFSRPGYLHGAEREIVILFARSPLLRTSSVKKLPYDLVFLLNRYFAEMGHAVEAAGGRIDKFIGDGVMALFGLDSGVEARLPRGAGRGQGHMSERMESLNRSLVHDTIRAAADRHRHPYRPRHRGRDGLRHGGLGSPRLATPSTPRAASEALTKTYACELVISEAR